MRPHVDGEDLTGRLMCYHCRHSFLIPKNATSRWTRVKCRNCGKVEDREHFRTHEDDPLKNSLGWPYDDPTVDYDC